MGLKIRTFPANETIEAVSKVLFNRINSEERKAKPPHTIPYDLHAESMHTLRLPACRQG
jgi:hypothetical protein